MKWWVLSVLLGLAAGLEVDFTGPVVPANNSEWTFVTSWNFPQAVSVEMELDLHAYRAGIIGKTIDVFSIMLPSHYSVRITGNDNRTVLFHREFNESRTSVSAVIQIPQSSPSSISLFIQNQNTLFAIKPWIVGEVFSSSDQFDLRTKFPACPFPVYSQLMCGACYADVVAGSGTDELCIANAGNPIASKLSPQPIISCSNLGGCSGGSPYLAAQWTLEHGLIEHRDCPYQSGQCTPQDDVDRDGCVSCKALGFPWNTMSYKFKPIPLYPKSEYAIRKHIKTRGSVMVIFVAHTNFQEFFYTHPFGIYQDIQGSPAIGNHAVRLIGFGIEGETKYWIAVNSWDIAWGSRGTFKILRGSNFCLIEQYPVGLESLDLTAGVGQQPRGDPEHVQDYPLVGEWVTQDPSNVYWTQFIEKNRELILRELNCTELDTLDVQTKVSHGFGVTLSFKQGVVHIHVSPAGEVQPTSKRKNTPEISSAVLVH
jgi:cathepsin B